ncbi:zinc finger protein 827-like isoform X1 [Scleropages formosus]|uniref:zinc finger protein 827-like isoform X1 n=1 Tax=Scleropages formosus TaxID=113540 RepID=UPI0010FA7B25|nr:zinc finger protein 827-like isoform X1 [Scleropages formosus]
MPRRKQEQPRRLSSHLDRVEDEEVEREPVGEDTWFGNASDTPSESSYVGVQDDVQGSPDEPSQDADTSGESSLGCPTPVPRASVDLLGFDTDSISVQDALSSVVASLYGDPSQDLGKPLSSNLRRLLEAGSLKLDVGELASWGGSEDSPPLSLGSGLSPSSHHAQQLSALARKVAKNSSSSTAASPAPVAPAGMVKQEPCDPYTSCNGSGFTWGGGLEAWLSAGSSVPSSLSPDSAIQKLKAAANAVRQDKNVLACVPTSSASSLSGVATGGRTEEPARFDAFASPFSSQSASSTLAALSKKVSERGLSGGPAAEQLPNCSFLSLVSMAPSAALLKEVAARAAESLVTDKKEKPLMPASPEDSKPLLDRNQKAATPGQPTDLLLPSAPKGKVKGSSQGASPDEGGKPFQCPVCGLVIKRKSYWKRHMVIHTGLKSHQCPMCPFRCARKDNLKSHMKVHQHQDRGETFQCELCPFTSSRHFSLKLHMRCHQHFPRTELQVKEEPTSDTESKPLALGELKPLEGLGSPAPSDTQLQTSPDGVADYAYVKEEPQERTLSALSPFSLCRASPLGPLGPKASPPTPIAASLFSPDITTKTASDLLIKLSAANQKEIQKPQFCAKEETRPEETPSPRLTQGQPSYTFCQEGSLGPSSESPPAGSGLLNQDINMKVASELLMKLSENSKESKAAAAEEEPMEVEPPGDSPPAPSRLLGFSTLPGCETSERSSGLPDGLLCPQKTLFSQDISVKMASELLFKLSEKVSKAKNDKVSNMVGVARLYADERCRQSPLTSGSNPPLPGEIGSSTRAALQAGWEKLSAECGGGGGGTPPWNPSEQLHPCHTCGKVFGTRRTLSQHQCQQPGERKYKCHLCPFTAKCGTSLSQHASVHAAVSAEGSACGSWSYYYSCRVCGMETELSAQLAGHMALHGDSERWMFSLCCGSCDFACGEEGEMKTHVHAEHAVGVSCRSPLSETKSTSSSLSALSDSVSGSESGDIPRASDELKGLLATPSSMASRSSSNSHSGSGTEENLEKGFECVFCNFACKTRAMYERHLQVHLLARIFECDICHTFAKSPEQLLEHKKSHAVAAAGLKCPVCTFTTSQLTFMEIHLATHRPDGHLRCGHLAESSSCERLQRRNNGGPRRRARHTTRDTLHRPDRAFATTHSLAFSRHVRRHHGDRLATKSGLPASHALRSVALSVSEKQLCAGAVPASCYLSARDSSSSSSSSSSFYTCYEKYRNLEAAHLIPLTTLFSLDQFTGVDVFHSTSSLGPTSCCSSPSHPLSPTSLKHSFLAYLGLTERAKVV